MSSPTTSTCDAATNDCHAKETPEFSTLNPRSQLFLPWKSRVSKTNRENVLFLPALDWADFFCSNLTLKELSALAHYLMDSDHILLDSGFEEFDDETQQLKFMIWLWAKQPLNQERLDQLRNSLWEICRFDLVKNVAYAIAGYYK